MSMDPAWVAVSLTALGGSAVAGSWLVRKAARLFRKADEFFDDYRGTPPRPGVPANPGVMERLQSIEESQAKDRVASVETEARTAAILADLDIRLTDVQQKTNEVHHETQPNGGRSMKDQMNRLDPEYPEKEQG